MISYAQNFEDVLLWRALKEVIGGFYVDVGAHHPTEYSVTRWFYDQGWSGINIEPNPAFSALLAAERPRDTNLRLAAGAERGTLMLRIIGDTGLSTLSADVAAQVAALGFETTAEAPTEVQPLSEILEPFSGRDIHFLKIDVEGHEAEVVAGMDFARHRPWVVLIEATRPMTPELQVDRWHDLLLAAEYRFVWFDGLNRWYVAAEREELGAEIARPPNVFDRFVSAQLAKAEAARRDAEAAARKAEGEAAAERVNASREAASAAALRAAISSLDIPNPPRALRIVLPFARAIRAVSGLFTASSLPVSSASGAEGAAGVADEARPEPASPAAPSLPRRIARKLFRIIVLPVARPIAHRYRNFMLAGMEARLGQSAGADSVTMQMLQGNAGRSGQGGSSASAIAQRLQAMEDLLMTLAVQLRAQDRADWAPAAPVAAARHRPEEL